MRLAIEMLGGKCVSCGALDVLEIDHIDPHTKKYDISDMWSWGLNKFLEELSKCQILCNPCHVVKTTTIDQSEIQHGSYSYYKHRNCRCGLCVEANRLYMRRYRFRKRNTGVV